MVTVPAVGVTIVVGREAGIVVGVGNVVERFCTEVTVGTVVVFWITVGVVGTVVTTVGVAGTSVPFTAGVVTCALLSPMMGMMMNAIATRTMNGLQILFIF
jgi:hypothetical protein